MNRGGPIGDTAVLVPVADPPAGRRLAGRIGAAGWAGVEELVVGADSLLVVFDPAALSAEDVLDACSSLSLLAEDARSEAAGRVDAGSSGRTGATTARDRPRRHHDLTVAFDGPDLAEVASRVGATPAELARQLEAAELEVAFVGFVPGFAYLQGLPPALAAVPRRDVPRPRVPAGAVALGGGYAGVYPLASAGGWRLLGRTDVPLLDLRSAPYSRLVPGDTVRLRPAAGVGSPPATARAALRAAGPRRAAVLEPGLQTTVQDLGRRGVAAAGIPPAGAADARSLRLANAAVGNAAGAAALEVTGSGPVLRFDCEAILALVGEAALSIDGRPMPPGAVQRVPAGAAVSVGAVVAGARAYLAVAGGFATEPLFGSRSGDVVSGLGAGPLRGGDELPIGEPGRPRGRFTGTPPARPALLRVLPGPAAAGGELLASLVRRSWVVGERSDRAGLRLRPDGEAPVPAAGAVRSHGVVTGAVQLPPGGEPIVLGVDHGTIGGYPVVAGVISADWPVLGQLQAGDEVRLEAVDAGQAGAARVTAERALAGAVSGWYPLAGA